MHAEPPAAIGDYEIISALGAGGMGVVYEARHRTSGELVALKTLHGGEPTMLYRLKREFRALCDVSHPNLVGLYDLVVTDGHCFFTMELVPGVDFSSHVRGAAGDLERVRDAFRQLASGLCALHGAGLVHRDVKPTNILVTPGGRVVLLDFGLARDREPGDSFHGAIVGTVEYMAPEQATSTAVTPAADWYSVGVLLYEALTGACPYDGPRLSVLMQKQTAEAPRPSAAAAGVPGDLDELCVRLLQRDPARRPEPPEVFRLLGGEPDGATAVTSPRSSALELVGRGAELDALREAIARPRGPQVEPIYLRGPSGVGKTMLVEHLLSELDQRAGDTVWLRGRCAQRESVPYNAVDGIIDRLSNYLASRPDEEVCALLPREAPLVMRLFPVLERVPAIADLPRQGRNAADAHDLRSRSIRALRTLLVRLTRARTVVLVIDDLQWMDADSVELLSQLLEPGSAPPLALVATVRVEPGEPLPSRVARLAEELGAAREIDVRPLPAADAVELARRLLHRAGIAGVDAAEIATDAGGHPLFISELVHHLGAIEGTEHKATQLDEVVWARVQHLEPSARRLLEVIAVAGAPLPLAVAVRAAEIEPAQAHALAGLLRFTHLARGVAGGSGDLLEPYHDRVRAAVAARLPSAVAREHHRRIADALRVSGAATHQPERLLHHLEMAGEHRRAAQHAADAARRAADALAFEQAAGLYRSALELGEFDAADRIALQLELAEALGNAGRGFEAAELFQAVAPDTDPATRIVCQRRAAEQYLLNGHLDRGLEALELVLIESGIRLPGTPRRALVSLLAHRARLRLRGLRWNERHEAEVSPSELERLDVCTAVGSSMSVVDNIRGADFQARALLMALRCGEPHRVGRCIANEAILQATQGQRGLRRAESLADEAFRIAEATGSPYLRGWSTAARALIRHFRGEFADAIDGLSVAEAHLREQPAGSSWELSSLRMFQLYALQKLGRFRALREQFSRLVADAQRRGDRYTEATLKRAFNQVWLIADDIAAARHDLASAQWAPPGSGYHLQHFYALRARCEVDLYTGRGGETREREADEMRAVRRSLLLRVQTIRIDFLWLSARLALQRAAGATNPSALRIAQRAARKLARERVGYAVAPAHLVSAAIAHLRGDEANALHHLARATEVADHHQLGLHAAAARHCRTQLDGQPSPDGDPTAWMSSEGVANHEAMTRLIAPGFDPR